MFLFHEMIKCDEIAVLFILTVAYCDALDPVNYMG